MNSGPAIVICCALLFLGSVYPASAQSDECPVGDHACLDQHFGTACVNIRDGATEDTCSAWLVELQRRPDIGEPDAQLLMGTTYRSLSRHTDDPNLSRTFRELATATVQQLVDQTPTNVRALHRLATTASNNEDRAEILRRVVAIDPTDLTAVERLAAVLINISGTDSARERIDIQEHAYDQANLSDNRVRLRLAQSLLLSYRMLIDRLVAAPGSSQSDPVQVADVEARRSAFIDQVREDLRIDTMRGEVHLRPASDSDRTAAHLSLLCRNDAVSVLGGRDCIESLDAVVEAATMSGGTEQGFHLADAAALTMRSLIGNDRQLSADFPDWRSRFAASLLQLIANGIETPNVYASYAVIELEPEVLLPVLRRGLTSFPDDRDVAVAMAYVYVWNGMRDDAVEQFLLIDEDAAPDTLRETVAEWIATYREESHLWRTTAGNPDPAIDHLTVICHRHALSRSGARDCMESLVDVIERIAASPQAAAATRLADAVGSILVAMVIDEWRFQRDFPDWRERFAESLRTLMTSGVPSGAVYYAYYYFELDDPGARLSALQQGSTLFPENRDIARALGEEYVRYGMRDEAVEQFVVAWEGSRGWDGSLEYVQGRVDEWLSHSPEP